MRGFGVIAVLMLIGTSAMAVERPALRRTLPAFERGQLVPLPRPRPPEAPTAPVRAAEPATAPTPEEQGPSDCFLRVTESLVQATPLPAIAGPGECGAADVLTLEAIMLPDKRRVALQPPATMRCSMAEAMANWVRDDVARVLKGLGSPLAGIENYTSYECRSRNGIPGAKLSEHGRANALDIRAFVLGDRRQFVLTDYEADEDLRKELRASACGRFTTVLGPGSDGYHESHIHVDLAERHSGYRICQWNVLTEPPIPLPRARPPEAPQAQAQAQTQTQTQTQTQQQTENPFKAPTKQTEHPIQTPTKLPRGRSPDAPQTQAQTRTQQQTENPFKAPTKKN